MLNTQAMIIACPACATRYVVPDNAIGVDGRTVRCAKCRHSWFQDGPEVAAPEPPPPPQPPEPPPPEQPPPPVAEPVAEPEPPAPPRPEPVERPVVESEPEPAPEAVAEPAPEPEPESAPEPKSAYAEPEAEPAYSEPEPVPAEPPAVEEQGWSEEQQWSDYDDDGESRFAHEPPFRARINRTRMWTWAAALFAMVSFGAIGAVAWYGLPDWMPFARPTFAEAQPDLVLDFPPNRQDRRTLPNGAEFFGASGTVTNVGRSTRSVPTILIVLRDARERVVYSWEVAPPKRRLAPGESMTINEAVTDVPKSAKFAEIGWKPG